MALGLLVSLADTRLQVSIDIIKVGQTDGRLRAGNLAGDVGFGGA